MTRRFGLAAVCLGMLWGQMAAADITAEGRLYRVECNDNGYVLQPRASYPAPASTDPETIYLGSSCDALHRIRGSGSWCWTKAGVTVTLPTGIVFFRDQLLLCGRTFDPHCACN